MYSQRRVRGPQPQCSTSRIDNRRKAVKTTAEEQRQPLTLRCRPGRGRRCKGALGSEASVVASLLDGTTPSACRLKAAYWQHRTTLPNRPEIAAATAITKTSKVTTTLLTAVAVKAQVKSCGLAGRRYLQTSPALVQYELRLRRKSA